MEPIIKVYVSQIKKGLKALADVPENIKEKVELLLNNGEGQDTESL